MNTTTRLRQVEAAHGGNFHLSPAQADYVHAMMHGDDNALRYLADHGQTLNGFDRADPLHGTGDRGGGNPAVSPQQDALRIIDACMLVLIFGGLGLIGLAVLA